MREYSKISPKFWIGETGKAIKKQGMEAQIVSMYLLTSPHANMLGLYYCPVVFISHETGLTFEGASKGLKRAKQAGFCMYDDETEMVWVMEMAAYQIADHLSPNDNRVKGVNTEYQNLPENPFLSLFYGKYKDAFCLSECRDSVVNTEAPSKPLLSQEQEQEQDQKQEQDKNLPAALSLAPEVETVLQESCRKTWSAYSSAYFDRYGTEPVRNAKVNACVKNFVKRIPAEEAPEVARFFVGHNDSFYVRKMHDFGLLLADSEKVRTEWATNRTVTATKARQLEKSSGMYDAVSEILAERGMQ